VGLWSHFIEGHTYFGGEPATVINIPGSGEHPILDQKVSIFQELSIGQRQLFALCRALVKVSSLRHSGVKPVVVLDEVTSSLDPVTESTIHRIIDEEFTERGHTVIIVAHRLDALALMADGQLQEVIEHLGPVVFQRFRQLE
jgi:ABC-type multidrug transport system fused ATPase/permease subunit